MRAFFNLIVAGNKVYWTVRENTRQEGQRRREIRRADLDGSSVEVLFTVITAWRGRWIRDMAVDPTSGKIYWTTGGELLRANLNGSQREIVVNRLEEPDEYQDEGMIDGPDMLVVDAPAGKVYWETRTRPREIRRANLNGSQMEILFELEEDEGVSDMVIVHP